jgi:hypothetical protein
MRRALESPYRWLVQQYEESSHMMTSRKSDWVIMIALTVIICLRYNGTFEDYVGHLLNVPQGDAPGGGPPFWFLRRDFLDGICAATAMFLATLLVAVTWKLNRRTSFQAFFMAWIWCMPGTLRGLIIWWRCPHLMDPQRAVSPWATSEQLLNDPLIAIAMGGSAFIALATVFAFRKQFRAELPQQPTASTAAASTS